MNYQQALALLDAGKKVRLPEWTGFWFLQENVDPAPPDPKRASPIKILALTRTGDVVRAWDETDLTGFQHRTDWQEVTEGMGFDFAILALKAGKKVCRTGWNGKGMWLGYVAGDQWGLGSDAPFDYGAVPFGSLLPWIGMKTADGKFVPWLASQTDMLATDWQIADLPSLA